jgi:hypothetical protein
MNKRFAIDVSLGLILAVATASGFAQAITPTFATFGALPAATFGGSGIPNTDVAITTFFSPLPNSLLILGTSAAQRCNSGICGAPLTNDGAGTFTAQSGSIFAANPTYASWNINFYASGNTNLYSFKLLYDFNPAVANVASTHGEFRLFTITGIRGSRGLDQGSSNMGFGSLTTSLFGANTAPSFTPFNPNVNGEYSFALVASDRVTGLELARSAVIVNAVPEPEGYVLGLAGLFGLAVAARRRRSVR